MKLVLAALASATPGLALAAPTRRREAHPQWPRLGCDTARRGRIRPDLDRPTEGELIVRLMFRFDATPTLTEAELAKRIVGKRYTDKIGCYARPSMRDCAITPLGAPGCKMHVKQTWKREVCSRWLRATCGPRPRSTRMATRSG